MNYAQAAVAGLCQFRLCQGAGHAASSPASSTSTRADLAYIRNHYIYLDHDQTWTGSAAPRYRSSSGALAGTKFGADMIYGSGLRRDSTAGGRPPQRRHLPGYAPGQPAASATISPPLGL